MNTIIKTVCPKCGEDLEITVHLNVDDADVKFVEKEKKKGVGGSFTVGNGHL